MSAIALTGTDAFTCGMELPTKISQLMERRKVSQSELARATGMAQTAISRVLAGKQRLYLDQATRIASFLGASVDYLADEGLDAPPPDLSPPEQRAVEMVRALGLPVEEVIRRLSTPPGAAPGFDPSTNRVASLRDRTEALERLGGRDLEAAKQDAP